ncbi:fimbrial protein [Burkholderia stagnalis]|nr:fimbria adhesin protein [Burkholderia stagnalis]
MTPTGGKPSSAPLVYELSGFNTGDIDPSVPNGTILALRSVPIVSGGGAVTCSSPISPLWYRGTTPLVTNNTYWSGIPGIGMKFRYQFAGGQNGYLFPYADPGIGNSVPYLNKYATLEVTFVKYGPITASGVVVGEIAGWFAEGDRTQIVSIRINGGIVVEPKVPTCRVTTPAITVPLGNMPSSTFSGVGTVSPSKPFNIVLQCSGGDAGTVTNVHTTLTDHTDPGNVSDTLSLATDSTATGIGIQVLNGSTVIKYGPDSSATGNTNQWKAGEAGNGTFTIPLTARYIQTAPKVTAGTADGLATFTMSYQ